MPVFSAKKGPRSPAYLRIANQLRDDILAGRLAVGARLPATDKLAVTLSSSICTVHNALRLLVREGRLERLNGNGTYVCETVPEFTCAGIYHCVDICANENPAYLRSIHGAILKRLRRDGKMSEVFIDSRPFNAQGVILPALEQAILQRRIQCLFAPALNPISQDALDRLSIPLVSNSATSRGILATFEDAEFLSESVKQLVARGCRSIGFISHLTTGRGPHARRCLASFLRAVARNGATTREEWQRPGTFVPNEMAHSAYEQFKAIWALPDRPDGLIVFPDEGAKGVNTAVLEIGIQTVIERMKFVFHRNMHINHLCPFPVTWGLANEDDLASAMLDLLQRQLKGERVQSIRIPYTFLQGEPPPG